MWNGKTLLGNAFQRICCDSHFFLEGVDFMAQISIRLTDQEKKKLSALALTHDLTVSQILRSFIRKYIKEHEHELDRCRI